MDITFNPALKWVQSYRDYKIQQKRTLCDMIFNHPHQEKQEGTVEVLQRIGSESKEAEVYLVSLPDQNLGAMKIMPRKSIDDISKNSNEIQVASQASELALNEECRYFPHVYASGHCSNVSLYPGSQHIPRAIEWAQYERLLSQYPGKERMIEILIHQGLPFDRISQRLNLKYKTTPMISADILISELANEDMGQWALRGHSLNDWKLIIKDVLNGLHCLHVDLGFIHNDMHLGNVLITEEERALIHDFGKAEPIGAYDFTRDYTTFLYSLLDETKGYYVPDKIQVWATSFFSWVDNVNKEDINQILLESLSNLH